VAGPGVRPPLLIEDKKTPGEDDKKTAGEEKKTAGCYCRDDGTALQHPLTHVVYITYGTDHSIGLIELDVLRRVP
jgi:hypothetical protein